MWCNYLHDLTESYKLCLIGSRDIAVESRLLIGRPANCFAYWTGDSLNRRSRGSLQEFVLPWLKILVAVLFLRGAAVVSCTERGDDHILSYSTLLLIQGHFRRVRKFAKKTTVSFVTSVCLSVRPSAHVEQLGSHSTDFGWIRYLTFFRKSVENNGCFTQRRSHIYDNISLNSS